MAEIEKTQNYGLTIFNDAQTTLTFKEFRKLLAGIGEDEDSFSNMQKIDAILKQYSVAIDDSFLASKNYTDEQISAFKELNDELIKVDENGNLILGGENGKPMEFKDGSKVAYLKDGVFTVGGVEVDSIRIVDYLLKYNATNKHLQLSYAPKNGGVK